MLARFPYGGTERTELIDWVTAVNIWARREPCISDMINWKMNDTPVTMCRNAAVWDAIEHQVDILGMVDSDMEPDIDRTVPFAPAAFDFITRRWDQAPTIIAAPYCQGAPQRVPTLGRWRQHREGYEIKADLFTREEATLQHSIQEVPFLGTGVMFLDLRIFTGFPVGGETVKLPPPWFEYEWTDQYHRAKASTEDTAFTRNVSMLFARYGLPTCFAHWDCWAYHWKPEQVGKPLDLSPMVMQHLIEPWEAAHRHNGHTPEEEVPIENHQS